MTAASAPASLAQAQGHHSARNGWLRAAVLGANDGLISTSSLVLGVAAANPASGAVALAALAATVAGALSMAAGEYVSVSSQADAERADLAQERAELAAAPQVELRELTGIYVGRGLSPELATEVALQLSVRDALAAHARDELGITEGTRARPLQAAVASACAFAAGAAIPVLLAAFWPLATLAQVVAGSSLPLLGLLGAGAAHLGGAALASGATRVMFWGALAMAATSSIGQWFGSGGVP